jgi:DNA mismatch repair protein MutH
VVQDDFFKWRADVLSKLRSELPGKNLYELAATHGVTIRKEGRLNKGWVGQTVEMVAGLGIDNSKLPDGADFELKSTSFLRTAEGWNPKETIKVTQLNPKNILEEVFENSSLWSKLSRLILVGCHHESAERCSVISVSSVDITSEDLVNEIRAFWDDVRYTICSGDMPDFPYLGRSDDYIQLRPTGTGKASSICPITGRKFPAQAFYATKRLIRRMLDKT